MWRNGGAPWLLAALMLAGPAVADLVEFVNGDRLTGEVVCLVDGRLTVRSQVAGQVVVPGEQVAAVTTDAPVTVHLERGEVLEAALAAGPEPGTVELRPAGEAPVRRLSLGALVAVNPPPPPAPPRPRWTGQIETGLGSRRGNADRDNADLAVQLRRTSHNGRLGLSGSYHLDRDKSTRGSPITVDNTWAVGARYDYSFSPLFFTFVQADGKGDRVKDLDARVLLSVGAGWRLPRTADFNFSADLGLSWNYEDFSHGKGRNDKLSLLLASHLDKRLLGKVMVLHDLEWRPTFEDLGDSLLTSSGEVRYYLTSSLYSSLSTAVDYDPTPAAGTRPVNLKYGLGVGFGF